MPSIDLGEGLGLSLYPSVATALLFVYRIDPGVDRVWKLGDTASSRHGLQ